MTNHVSMIGAAFAGNKGAAAMLSSSIESVLKIDPYATFSLFSMYPEEDLAKCPYKQVEIIPAKPKQLGVTINLLALIYRIFPPARRTIAKKSNAVSALLKSNVLLDQMGVSFTDGREKFLLFNTAALLPAFLLRVPVLKTAQAIGPFSNPVNKLVSRVFLPRVDKIITRGELTHNFAESIGLNNLVAGADAAFLLDQFGIDEAKSGEEAQRPLRVGVVPSEVVRGKYEKLHPEGYVSLISEVILNQRAQGKDVRLIAHSARDSGSRQNNDLLLCREIIGEVGSEAQVSFSDREQTIEQLRQEIMDCDILFTGRFHAMVSALSVGVVPVVMGWGHKYEEVLSPFGLESHAIPHQECTADLITRMLDSSLAKYKDLRQQISSALPSVIAKAQTQDEELRLYLR